MQNLQQLLSILQEATSQNSASLANATKALQENETKEGFHFSLLKIALSCQQNTDLNIRLLAVLYLKNGIERHWRTHGLSPLSAAEKNSIKNEILSCFGESVQQVALQFAVIISKIARYDYPKSWPLFFQTLLSSTSNVRPTSTELSDNTILLTFRLVMKELGSKQLPNDRKMFRELCCNSFSICYQVWEDHYKLVVQSLQNCSQIKEQEGCIYIDKLINILKTFRSMSVVLDEENFSKFMNALILSLQSLLNCFNLLPNGWTVLRNAFDKLLLVHSKIILDALELQNPFIIKFSNDIVNFNKQCIFAYSNDKDIFKERYAVNCLNILKAILSIRQSEINVMPDEELENLLRCLIFSFLPLNASDLENWEDDAEEFCSEEIGETWRYNLRPSSEVLFLTLLHYNSEKLIPLLLSSIKTVNDRAKNDSADINGFLVSDAVFTATGLACNELFDCLDFESWCTSTLLPYVYKGTSHPAGKIVHRRVLWLIEQWTGVKPLTIIFTTLYEFIISSLDRKLDMAVRLAAARALRQVLDDFEFDIENFAPYQERCTDALYMLLEDTVTGDAKMRVLHVLSFVIERLGPRVASCVNKLTLILPSVWQVSESHNMLRCAVVATLVNVVSGLCGNHGSLLAFLTNVIHTCTDISSSAHIYLLIDGLDLWLALLHNTHTMNESLLQLFNNMYGLLELSSESLKECLEIIESYILLGGETFIGGRHGSDLALAISSLITDVRDECLVMVARLIEMMLRIAPTETPFVFQQYLRDTIRHVLDANDGTVLATSRLIVVSRLAFHNTPAFWNLFFQQSGDQTNEAVLAFLKVVSDRIDSVVETAQRKVIALACLALLERFTSQVTLQRALAYVLSVCIQVLYDVCDENRVDTFVSDASNDELKPEQWETQHSLRTRALIRADPNHKLSLPTYARMTLERLSTQCGADALQQMLLISIGNDSLQELQEFLQ